MTKYFCSALIVWRPILFHRGSELQDVFAPSTHKRTTTTNNTCVTKRSTALSVGGPEAFDEESDGARYATRSLTRCTIKILWVGGAVKGASSGVVSRGGEALPYKPIRNMPFFRYRFSA